MPKMTVQSFGSVDIKLDVGAYDSYKVYGFSIQYRRYLTTAAKRERRIAV